MYKGSLLNCILQKYCGFVHYFNFQFALIYISLSTCICTTWQYFKFDSLLGCNLAWLQVMATREKSFNSLTSPLQEFLWTF